MFGSNLKACVVAASGPGQVDGHLQITVHLLVNGPAKLGPVVPEKPQEHPAKNYIINMLKPISVPTDFILFFLFVVLQYHFVIFTFLPTEPLSLPLPSSLLLSYSHVGVELEVPGLVAQGKVVLGQFGLGRVEGDLVARQPALVAEHGGPVDGGAGHVKVQVTAHVDHLPLVVGLQLGTLLAAGRVRKGHFVMAEDRPLLFVSLSLSYSVLILRTLYILYLPGVRHK